MSATIEADRIQDMGQRFGIKMLGAIQVLGLPWSEDCEQFKITLQEVGDRLNLSEAAHDLFMSEARLAFYGLMTDRQNIRDWSNARDQARADLVAEAREDEADRADYYGDLARVG